MSPAMDDTHREVLDCVGIGFGPANLALAIALDEHNRQVPARHQLTSAFLERQPRFGWHRGMLIDDATMQVSFLKDLVTQRNPASDFSFVSYLHSQGRLSDFINHKTLFPLRIEFHDYLEWAAARVDDVVRYSTTVDDVVPVTDPVTGAVTAFDVRSGDSVVRGRNVVVATGLELKLPPDATLSARVWHNLDLLRRVEAFAVERPRRFVVVGAGQSAAEAVGYLHRRYPGAEVCSVFFRYGYSPADDSAFANRIFDPEAVDTYFDAPGDVKRMLFDYHRNTNYSVVDIDLIDDLYRRRYAELVTGRQRLRMMPASRVVAVDDGPEHVRVEVEDLATGARDVLDADVLVYATGYAPVPATRILGRAAGLVALAADGVPEIDRDYRIRPAGTAPPVEAGIYLQGGTETSHGITSTLLSNVAVRAGEIASSMAARHPVTDPAQDATFALARD
jgi:L-ornithine N5-oxygenase